MYKKIFNILKIFYKNYSTKNFYYSFSGVDSIVEKIFKNQNNGFYIDVGCQQPIKNNNTYLLYKKGWEGINVDLDSGNIDTFNAARKYDHNVRAALSGEISEKDLYFYHKKSPINTLVKEVSDFQKAKVTQVVKVTTNTLNKIIENSPYANEKFDFMSVDVEGHELDVLKGFDLDKYEPKILVVEYLDLSISQIEIKNLNIENVLNSELYKYISSRGYILSNCLYSDLVFIKNSFRD